MKKAILLAVAMIFCVVSFSFATEKTGTYKIGKKKYTYVSQQDGKQTAFAWKPSLPDTEKVLVEAVLFTIVLTYGKDSLDSDEYLLTKIEGVPVLRFKGRGHFINAAFVQNEKSGKVEAWSLFESDN